jgi:hypothetical protein
MNPEGGGVSAWPSQTSPGRPAVAVREDFPTGAVQTALVGGGAGGEVAELAVGRSGMGDGLVAFRQGAFGNAAIVAAQITAPPTTFVVTVPKKWVKPSRALVSWLPAQSAAAPLSYHIVLDGHVKATRAGVFSAQLDPHGLGSGRHRLQVLATDVSGQSTLSPASTLMVDGTAPTVTIKRSHGRLVTVRVADRDSGVDVHAVSVNFGDARSVRGRARATHRYSHSGVYQITVRVRDKLGNAAVVRQVVSVP